MTKKLETYDDLLALIQKLSQKEISFILNYNRHENQFALNMTEGSYKQAVRSFPFLKTDPAPKFGFTHYFKVEGMATKKAIVHIPEGDPDSPVRRMLREAREQVDAEVAAEKELAERPNLFTQTEEAKPSARRKRATKRDS